MDDILEMPDKLRNRFVQFCLQNKGRLSPDKRDKYFSALSEEQVRALERIVQEYLLVYGGTRPG